MVRKSRVDVIITDCIGNKPKYVYFGTMILLGLKYKLTSEHNKIGYLKDLKTKILTLIYTLYKLTKYCLPTCKILCFGF